MDNCYYVRDSDFDDGFMMKRIKIKRWLLKRCGIKKVVKMDGFIIVMLLLIIFKYREDIFEFWEIVMKYSIGVFYSLVIFFLLLEEIFKFFKEFIYFFFGDDDEVELEDFILKLKLGWRFLLFDVFGGSMQ